MHSIVLGMGEAASCVVSDSREMATRSAMGSELQLTKMMQRQNLRAQAVAHSFVLWAFNVAACPEKRLL